MVTKKFFLSGENAIPCGPLMSLWRIRVSVVFSRFAPFGPNRTVTIRSADSQTSLTQYSFLGGSPLCALKPQLSKVHRSTGFHAILCRRFIGSPAAHAHSNSI